MCPPLFAALGSAISSVGTMLGGAAAATGAAAAGGAAAAAGAGAAAAGAGAAAAGGGLFSMQGLSMLGTVGSGIMQFMGAQAQAKAAEQVARNNQQMAEYAAEDAQRRGEKEVQETQRRAAQLRGTQRSMMAARGLDLSVGTPADILDQTEFFAAQDVATSRTNARREAWAVRADASNQGTAARAEASRLRMGSYGSLLGTAASVSDKWDRYTRKPTGGMFATS